MFTIISSPTFDKWLFSLKDQIARTRILARLKSASYGNFGDAKPVGDGVSEMRIHYGAGYRVYFRRTELTVYIVLMGGDKSSQKRDIELAKELARDLKITHPKD